MSVVLFVILVAILIMRCISGYSDAMIRIMSKSKIMTGVP